MGWQGARTCSMYIHLHSLRIDVCGAMLHMLNDSPERPKSCPITPLGTMWPRSKQRPVTHDVFIESYEQWPPYQA